MLVGGDVALLERFGRPTVADEWPGEGPLGGVLTALRAVGSEGVVVAACDLPWLDADTVRAVVEAGRRRSAAQSTSRSPGPDGSNRRWRGGAAVRSVALTDVWTDGVRAIHEAIGRLSAVRRRRRPGGRCTT